MNAGTGPVTFTQAGGNNLGMVAAGATNELVLTGARAGIVIAIPVENNAGGSTAAALTVSGTAGVTFTAANTYTGTTFVNRLLTLSGAGSINSSSGIIVDGSGAEIIQTSSITLSPPITLTRGTVDGIGAVGTIIVGNGTGGIITNGDGSNGTLTTSPLDFTGTANLVLNIAAVRNLCHTARSWQLLNTPNNGVGEITINLNASLPLLTGSTYDLISYANFTG